MFSDSNRRYSDQFLALVDVLDAELGVGGAAIVVLHDGVTDVYRVAGLDAVVEVGHIEGYGRDVMIWMRFLDELELEVASFSSHLAAHTVVIYIVSTEYWCMVARAERLDLLEDPEELRSDLGEVQACIHLHHRSLHFRDDGAGDRLLDSLTESRDIFLLESKSCSVKVSTEVLQKVGTTFNRILQIKSVYASRRAGHQTSL